MHPERMSEKETELLKDTLLSYVSRSAIGQAAAKVLFQEIATLRAENLRLRSALQLWLDEQSRVMREVSEIGYSEFNATVSMVQQSRAALASKQEKEPCPNCKETEPVCACLRNKCRKCGEPVGNVTFVVCDACWDAESKASKQEGEKCRCGRCGKNEAEPDHPCPYKEDIGNDSKTLCNCCEDCQHQCAMDI